MPARFKLSAISLQPSARKAESRKLKSEGSQKGFTLVEILVSIGIMALLTAVTIPNLREFSKNQELDNAASKVLNTLKTAQSSANSRIKCPDGDISDYWTVRLTATHFSLLSHCQRLNSDVFISTNSYSGNTANPITATSDRCQPGETVDIIFSKSGINYLCFSSVTQINGTVRITISKASGNPKIVRVENGGILKIE